MELESNPKFKVEWNNFLESENPVAVEVHPDECRLNPANFAVLRNDLILINKAPKTVKRLIEAGVKKDSIIMTDEEITILAILKGSIGCTIGYTGHKDGPTAKSVPAVSDDITGEFN